MCVGGSMEQEAEELVGLKTWTKGWVKCHLCPFGCRQSSPTSPKRLRKFSSPSPQHTCVSAGFPYWSWSKASTGQGCGLGTIYLYSFLSCIPTSPAHAPLRLTVPIKVSTSGHECWWGEVGLQQWLKGFRHLSNSPVKRLAVPERRGSYRRGLVASIIMSGSGNIQKCVVGRLHCSG